MTHDDILDRVLNFCDVRGDTFHWRQEPARSELFRVFLESHAAQHVSADEIHDHLRQTMLRQARWNVPMEERVAEICAAWDDWTYAVESYSGTLAGA